MRALSVTLPLALLLVALAPAVHGDHATDTFTATGHVAAPNPAGGEGASASRRAFSLTGDTSLDGLDADVVALPAWASGHALSVVGASTGDYDLDVEFLDENRGGIGFGNAIDGQTCLTDRPDESCGVPEGAAYAVVHLFLGTDVTFTLTVVSTPAVPPPPGSETLPIPTWFTWGKTELTIVVVPSGLAPLYDTEFGILPEGTGVGADSVYIAAMIDAMEVWETAIDAYAAGNASRAWMEGFEFDIGVLGVDRTVEEMEAADVRVVLAPTGTFVLGVAIATETTDEGEFLQCDIVNFEWLVFPYTSNDVYNVHMQEFGHCLGLDHPEAPMDDPMQGSYEDEIGNPANPRYCLTSLDVRGLEGAYAWVPEAAPWRAPPSEVTLPASQYVAYPATAGGSCPNPE